MNDKCGAKYVRCSHCDSAASIETAQIGDSVIWNRYVCPVCGKPTKSRVFTDDENKEGKYAEMFLALVNITLDQIKDFIDQEENSDYAERDIDEVFSTRFKLLKSVNEQAFKKIREIFKGGNYEL